MPKAEVGSTKHLANKMKAKGLQRLRWYCQICEKQCRDENGFKQHTLSEGHVRNMLLVGEDPKKFINDYSNQFKRDFLQLLKTSHGEKKVHMNNFYQEYIHDKEHIHMNSTKWPSLTEFAKHLGTQGVCKVEEGERGLEIQWIDDSAEAIKRREDIKRKDRQAKGDEDLDSKLLAQQIRRAKEEAARSGDVEQRREITELDKTGPVKVSLNLGLKGAPKTSQQNEELDGKFTVSIDSFSSKDVVAAPEKPAEEADHTQDQDQDQDQDQTPAPPPPAKISLSGLSTKSKSNPLMKKSPFAKKPEQSSTGPEKRMSNAERIMKEEMERKRIRDDRGFNGGVKRTRLV